MILNYVTTTGRIYLQEYHQVIRKILLYFIKNEFNGYNLLNKYYKQKNSVGVHIHEIKSRSDLCES